MPGWTHAVTLSIEWAPVDVGGPKVKPATKLMQLEVSGGVGAGEHVGDGEELRGIAQGQAHALAERVVVHEAPVPLDGLLELPGRHVLFSRRRRRRRSGRAHRGLD